MRLRILLNMFIHILDSNLICQRVQNPIMVNKKGNSDLVSGYLLLYTMRVAKFEKALQLI